MGSPSPFLAPSLRNLRAEVDALWPARSRVADGWIGDEAHQQRDSDHNPAASGVVRALDITRDGVDPRRLLVALVSHPATHYVIFHGVLYSRRVRFIGVDYQGPDPHLEHLHVSIRHTLTAERARSAWLHLD